MPKIKLTLENPITIERFSNELRKLVEDVTSSLKDFFVDSIDGLLGEKHKEIVTKLFNEWCYRNDITSLKEMYEVLLNSIKEIIHSKNESDKQNRIDRLVKDITEGIRGNKQNVHNILSKCIADVMIKKDKIREVTWYCTKNLLMDHMHLFLNQTAHVIIARVLVYRIMEDKGVAPLLFSQQIDPLHALLGIRRKYEKLLPNIYALSEFDWWYIPDVIRGLLSDKQIKILRRHEDRLRNALRRMVKVLISYDLSEVNFDLWQKVYQFYLPDEERQRLGGFYTPHELATLIIDLAGYVPEKNGLCKASVLDPASGSGTFVVEVTKRLIEHLESHKECHDVPRAEWEKARFILETVKNNIYAIDIHPFATFLTSLNLTMLLLNYYFKIHHQDPEYRLELNVITADSLVKSIQTSMVDFVNSRLKEACNRLEKYRKVVSMRFDYVFGNPPWGSVLKGSLSPLWNPRKRNEYKRNYRSATGKYDIYVLFIERGIEWLKEGGVLGMVVNNRFLTRDFGSAIRDIISTHTDIKYIVDLSEYGPELFPGATNYPVIIILEKHSKNQR